MWTMWNAPLMTSPTAVAGAIQERTVPGVPRLAIQPHPRPDTSDRAAMTTSEISPPRTSGLTRWRQSTPGPAQSQAM